MNSLLQLETFIIGNHTAVKKLASAKKAVLLVISDSHGQAEIVHSILQNFGEKSDAVVFCGDGVSDILTSLDESHAHTEFAVCIPPVVALVQGNGDSDRYPVEFNPVDGSADGNYYHEVSIPKHLIITVAGHKILITHGHYEGVYYSSDNLKEEMKLSDTEIALYGHSHIAKEENEVNCYMLNPGSCCMPRGGLPPSFAVLTLTAGNTIYDAVFYKLAIDYAAGGLSFTPFLPPQVSLW